MQMTETAEALTANVEKPKVVENPDSVDWTAEADLVVVGFGGAGVVAALEGVQSGASVLAVDRFTGGGATAMSGGVVYAGGTRHQREAGFNDTAEEMFKYLSFEGVPVREDTLRRFCESSNENIEWLEQFGVRFGSAFFDERIAYPPDGFFLYYSGMEKFRGEAARVAPRGHRTVGKGPTGQNYFAPLKDAALQGGVRFMPHAPVRRLIVDGNDRVLGVEVQAIPKESQAEHEALFRRVNPYKMGNGETAERAIAACREFEQRVDGNRQSIRARSGVVLAAGGYNYNLELFSRYRPVIREVYREIVRGGSMGCDGSGIELGTTVGGALSHMDRLFVTKPVSPPESFVYGVLVNAEGKRYIAEDAYLGNVGCITSEQSQLGLAWLILDRRVFRKGLKQLLWPLKTALSWWGLPALINILVGGTKRARTIEALAERCGVDSNGLRQTIDDYNRCAARGEDPEHGKLPVHIEPVDSPPYVALNMSMRNKWSFSGAMPYGGLTVDEDTGGVTRADGTVIGGLYAAGRTALGVCSESNFSGLSIADTVFSGRRAARAALRVNEP